MSSNPTPIILVTGGSRGLGRSAALHLARAGLDVIITYRQQAADADAALSEIRALGRKAAALQLDVGDVASFPDFSERLVETLDQVWNRKDFDGLVNNAGMGANAPIRDLAEADFDALMNVHFKGVLFLTQHLEPMLVDGGRILNVSTGLTRFTFPGLGAYAAMKGAVEVLTRYQAVEFGDRGITVNVLAPGAIETDFGGGLVRDNAEVNAHIASVTALGRVGLPADIGSAVAGFMSGGFDWMTGQRIEVSGGQSL
ncbi:hypothetical protein AWH62_08625 [Maricaulis sp. W15]|uniref:SDR family NAD(P)-dependent oxidoreductase n=1 Tax=Maricaulis sp. W15 TaxID=1772333 RepID=UPI000948A5C9|nr:SDR family oxidoreductase [Maricaulis sp. W15]OLF73009.1 hypothetical protein AWH62_08625 [Maricaulis sp. W15]